MPTFNNACSDKHDTMSCKTCLHTIKIYMMVLDPHTLFTNSSNQLKEMMHISKWLNCTYKNPTWCWYSSSQHKHAEM